MNRTQSILIGLILLSAPILAGAAPNPGSADFTSSGSWSEGKSDSGDSWSEVDLGDGVTFLFRDHHVFLTNSPGTFWFSPGDTNISFDYYLTSIAVDVQTPGNPSTNGGYMELQVSSHAGPFAFLATFAGFPNVTNVPPDPTTGSEGYTITTAPLSWAQICISSNVPNSTVPLVIRSLSSETPEVELYCNGASNALYQVQWCVDAVADSWTDLGTAKAGTGTNLHARAPVQPSNSQCFYRVLQFP